MNMTSPEITKIISRNLRRERDTRDIRSRVSARFQEHRRSKRSAALNQLRQVVVPKVVKKKTAAEEKLEKLKVYQTEKRKKMEELKKKQKPPFCSIVKIHHTGGTPFRNTEPEKKSKFQPMKLTALRLPTNTRSRTQAQELFQFKATSDTKPSTVRTAASRFVEKEGTRKPTAETSSKIGLTTRSNKGPITDGGINKQPAKQKTAETSNKPRLTTRNNKVPLSENGINKQPVKQKTVETSNKAGLTTRSNKGPLAENGLNKQPGKQKVEKVTNQKKAGQENFINRQQRTVPKRAIGKSPTVRGQVKLIKEDKAPVEKRVLRSRENISSKPTNGSKPKPRSLTKADKASEQKSSVKTSRQTRSRPGSKKDSCSSTQSEPVTDQSAGEDSKNDDLNDKKMDDASNPSNISDGSEVSSRGSAFQRMRLQKEIDRLTSEADKWSKQGQNNVPEHIKDEILAVVGQTRLLMKEKFCTFKSLIDRFDSPNSESLKVTLDDLEAYWDVMYMQVIHLDQQFKNLVELESNNWRENVTVTTKKNPKKTAPPKRKSTQVASKFKEFLKSRQNKTEEVSVEIELPATPIRPSVKPQDTTLESSLYMSVSRDDDLDFESNHLEMLKTPRLTPAVQRVLSTSRRRSSVALLTLKNTHLMKIPPSPKF